MSTETPTSTKGAQRAEAVQREIEAARARLAEACANPNLPAERLNDLVQSVAFLEGKRQVMVEVGQMQDHDVPKAEQVAYVLRMLTQSPSDTWSGRGNDTKRAIADGVRDTVGRLLYTDLAINK